MLDCQITWEECDEFCRVIVCCLRDVKLQKSKLVHTAWSVVLSMLKPCVCAAYFTEMVGKNMIRWVLGIAEP
jgi:hypothetical protein